MPAQSQVEKLMAFGMAPELAGVAGTFIVGRDLVATGSAIGDALLLRAHFNHITTSSASTGVQLPDWTNTIIVIDNSSGQTLNIFPHSTAGTINAGSAAAAQTIATAKWGVLFRATGINWRYVLVN